jgi:hypothetical protein
VQFLYCSTLEMPWTSECFPRAHRHHLPEKRPHRQEAA